MSDAETEISSVEYKKIYDLTHAALLGVLSEIPDTRKNRIAFFASVIQMVCRFAVDHLRWNAATIMTFVENMSLKIEADRHSGSLPS